MSDKIFLNARYAFRSDTLENWQSENPILEKGEPAVVTDGVNGEWLKIGDGINTFNLLEWKKGPKGEQGDTGPQGEKGDVGADGKDGKDAVTDQTYSPTSENAQSGKAVAEAISGINVAENWELIEEITVEQEAVVSRSYSGRYKKFAVLAYSSNRCPVFKLTAGQYIWEFYSYTADKNQFVNTYGEVVIPEKLFNVYATIGNSGGNATRVYPIIDRLTKNVVSYFRGFASITACKAGTTIKVYGVKA